MAQPPPSSLSLRGVLTLPYRLCNPPPAVGKVRSCAVTPVLDVRLDDVLARRHLPPIGLKDLEEYLLYVERAPENLYFILWLKDYTTRYQTWVQREKTSLVTRKDKLASKSHRLNSFSVPPTPDPSLAMFYLRAKQTFFTPNGEFELNIPSDILAPFHCTPHPPAWHTHTHDHSRSSLWHSQSVHPDPAVFAEVAIEARNMLNESLRRFVRAAYTNVGSQRAICGIIGGSFIALASGVVPLVLTTGRWNIGPHVFLIRLTAFPGLWLGLTILIASLQGVCLMIYVFGDLRQLRKFELTRPTISHPMPLPISSPMSSKSTPTRRPSLFVPTRPAPIPVPMSEKTAGATSPLSSLDSPISFVTPTQPRPAQLCCASLARSSCESCESDICPSEGCVEIDVSPAFFDDVPAPEGPATASCLHRPEYRLSPPTLTYVEPVHVRPEMRPRRLSTRAAGSHVVEPNQGTRSPRGSVKSSLEYGPTAAFIPNAYHNQSTASLSETTRSLRSQRSGCYFDFDALPPNRVGHQRRHRPPQQRQRLDSACVTDCCVPVGTDVECQLAPSTRGGVGHFFGRAQYKCNQRTSPSTPVLSSSSSSSSQYPSCDKSSFSDTSSIRPRGRFAFFATLIPSFTAGVPAFAAPLTEVQSPEVKRAQWEVVVRAALIAAVMSGTVTGVIVGVVP